MSKTDSLDMARLRELAEAATPGPWAWMGNQHSFYLATTHSGRRYVMGFRRMGTQAAQPVFCVKDRLVPAADLATFEVGDGKARGMTEAKADDSVYRYDINGFDAPDAAFIAAFNPATALALLDALSRSEEDTAFLLARAGHAGSSSFTKGRWTGMSSNAIVSVAFGGEQTDMPADKSDYLACVRTYRRLPRHRRTPEVRAALKRARDAYTARYPRSTGQSKDQSQ